MGLYAKKIVPRLLSNAMGSPEIQKLRPEVIKNASGAVLEIGVGAGHNLPLYKNISKLYALEFSPELTERAKQQAHELQFPVEFISASAESIPLPDACLDTVVSTWTFCSIRHPQQALKEISRVLRPNGTFVFIEHGISPRPMIQTFQNILTPVTKYFTGNCHMNRDIEKLIREARFDISSKKQFHENKKPLMYNTQGVATPALP